ncbi:MAG: M61 family metallopeptidase [Chitinophagaceae bacterium]|nr:M61 family metallopeptidase [Chitinophagaceae bacterium]
MNKIPVLLLCLLLAAASSAQKISYRMSFPNAVHHEAHIELNASGIPLKPAIFRMSRSSPGRYATHEFGKNVYDVTATDGTGKPVTVNRIDGEVYEVPHHNGKVTVSYTLYGNYADGTYAGIDPESIHLNMPAAFMWMKGMDDAPIEISFEIPKDNKGVIATQLVPTSNPRVFTAPGLQYFMDSPTKIGDLIMRQWTVSNPDGKTFTVRVALEANATDQQADELAAKVKKVVAEAMAVYGEFPNYDHGTYTFIASANPYVYGDGMEHRNSTMISSSFFNVNRLPAVFAHEYFHNWNVERIRPKTLEPFNFEKSNMSHELWFAEGFTQYYGELLLARAGLNDEKNYLQILAGLISTKQNTPGARFYSPVDASNHAVYVDAAVSIDRNNYANMFSSYYTYGAAIALALDLELQTRYGKTLDAYMRAMWKRFGKPEIPYTIPGMQEVLASVSDPKFAADFFSKYITGHEPIDYASLLAKAGYELKKAQEGRATAGINATTNQQGKFVISSNTVRGTAAYEAGLDINDELLKADDTNLKSSSDLTNYLQNKKPGDALTITYKHRNTDKTTTLVLKEQNFQVLADIQTVSPAMKKIRDTWFTSNVK